MEIYIKTDKIHVRIIIKPIYCNLARNIILLG
jgi:hypothetical protein